MPAAAVIPAPIAYIKFVAVKKLVVGFRNLGVIGRPVWFVLSLPFSSDGNLSLLLIERRVGSVRNFQNLF